MNYFKQALIQMRSQIKNTLILGTISTALLFSTHHIPYLNAFLLGLGLLILQNLSNLLMSDQAWPKNLSFLYKDLISYIGASLILFPSYVLGGSAFGILQNPQEVTTMLPLAAGLFMITVYFYLLISHSLRWHIEKKMSLAKSIDLVASASLRSYRKYFNISFYIGILLTLSTWTWGVGFIFTLPLLYYCSHFLFTDMDQKKLIAPVPL